MKRYAPTTHDPQDDRKPWAVMMPSAMGSYYLASEVEQLLAMISVHVKHAHNADSPVARKQAVQGLFEIFVSIGR